MLDITHAADYITVSWNIIRNHWKTSLVGHSDSNAGEDLGHLRVTYHHNWFDHTFERSPRVRFGETVHVFNNYYSNINKNSSSYAIASTMDAGAARRGQRVRNVQQACWSASGYADSDPGRLVARNNSLTNSGPCETNGTVAPCRTATPRTRSAPSRHPSRRERARASSDPGEPSPEPATGQSPVAGPLRDPPRPPAPRSTSPEIPSFQENHHAAESSPARDRRPGGRRAGRPLRIRRPRGTDPVRGGDFTSRVSSGTIDTNWAGFSGSGFCNGSNPHLRATPSSL